MNFRKHSKDVFRQIKCKVGVFPFWGLLFQIKVDYVSTKNEHVYESREEEQAPRRRPAHVPSVLKKTPQEVRQLPKLWQGQEQEVHRETSGDR